MGIARTLGLAGILLALFASPALAGGDDDAASWLRKGKAAESIDHDPVKAIEAYRQALVLAEVSAAGLEAGLRLLALYETGGDTAAALGTARAIAARYAPVMNEPTKELVLRALGRLVPPGTIERTPLGTVISAGPTPAAADAEPSPLVRRFEDAFQSLSVNDPRSPDYARLRADLLDKLRPLGADALPVLEWMIRSENLRTSTEAMNLLTTGFPTQGVPLLERLALDADVLVRGPALSALRKLQPGGAKWAALDRLRKTPALASQAGSIREQLRAEMDEQTLLAQHAAGDEESLDWLRAALRKGGDTALRRALEVGARDRAAVRDVLVTQTAGGGWLGGPAEGRRELEAFLRADPEAETNADIRRGLAALSAAHVNDVPETDVAGRLGARRAAWARIADMRTPEEVAGAMKALAIAEVVAPADLLTDPRWTTAFLSGWSTLALRDDEGSLGQYLETDGLRQPGPFWSGLAARLLASPEATEKLVGLVVQATGGEVPEDLADARWVEIAGRALSGPGNVTHEARFLATAAVQSQDPSFLSLYEKAATRPTERPHDALTEALPSFRGANLIGFLVELVGRSHVAVRAELGNLLLRRAEETLTPEELMDRIRKARDSQPYAAGILVGVLGRHRGRPELLTLLREEAAREAPLAERYAEALVELAARTLSQEAFPLLLRIYREMGDPRAAAAMKKIREYLDQVKTFEDWTRPAEDVATEVEASLSSSDPSVRLAAVHAIVVLERRPAIARLLRVIRTEKDASVLEEANQMLRKLSAAIFDEAPPAPTGAWPDIQHYKELRFGPDGKPIAPSGTAPPSPAAPTLPKDAPAPGK